MLVLVRIALAIGFLIDASVGLVALFAPQEFQPLFDVPVHDTLVAGIAGGEFLVVAALYAVTAGNPRRYRALLWLLALDQLFAVVLPAMAIANGVLPPTFKIVAPIPVSALLVVIFVVGATRLRRA